MIGLAESGGDGLSIAKEIYAQAIGRIDELVKPYAPVVDIARDRLPSSLEVARWDGPTFAGALRHNGEYPAYNLHFRQLLHVSFKIAAELGDSFIDALRANEGIVARNVTENLYVRHLRAIFG